MMINRLILFIYILFITLIYGATTVTASQNLILNSGFEDGQENKPTYWSMAGPAFWVTDEVFSGNKAMQLVLTEHGSASITSNLFRVTPHTNIEFSIWAKAQNVGLKQSAGNNFVITLNYYKADRITLIDQFQLLSTYGSFDWKKINDSLITPINVHYMSVTIGLTDTTGTLWADNVVITQTVIPKWNTHNNNISNPIIIPQPWQMSLPRESLSIKSVAILNGNRNPNLTDDIRTTFNRLDIPYRFLTPTQSTKAYNTIIHLVDSTAPELDTYLQTQSISMPLSWQQLGDQGYFVMVVPDPTQRMVIYLGGNTDVARFYAFQTLKQLITENDDGLYPATIIDWPTLPQRGITVQETWLQPQPLPLFERLAQAKFNFIWLEGAYLNNKFGDDWQLPLDDTEKALVQTYLKLAQRHFITPYFALTPPTQNITDLNFYMDEANITLIVEKFRTLYGLGVRHFGLSFSNHTAGQAHLTTSDVTYSSNETGTAHSYFINQIYQQLSTEFSDITLMIVPMDHRDLGNKGNADETYLQSLAQLPNDIGFYTHAVFLEDAQAAIRLTDRPHLVRDDFWASEYHTAAPEFVVPLERTTQFNEEIIQGYTFSPLDPAIEDTSLTSWFTAADYAWAPERYNPVSTFELVAAKRFGVKNRSDFMPTIDTPTIFINNDVAATDLISITTETPNVAIHYTLDGSTPTLDSQIFLEPIALPHTVDIRLKAVAYRAGYNDSGVVSTFFNQVASEALANTEPDSNPLPSQPATQVADVTEPAPETASILPEMQVNEPTSLAGQTRQLTTLDAPPPTNPYSSVSMTLSSIAVEGWRIWVASIGFLAVVLGASMFVIRQSQNQVNKTPRKIAANAANLPEKSQLEVLYSKIEAMLQENSRKSVADLTTRSTGLLEDEVLDLDTTGYGLDELAPDDLMVNSQTESSHAGIKHRPTSTIHQPTPSDTDAAEYRKVLGLISQKNFRAAQDHIFMYFLSEGKHNYRDVAVLFARLVKQEEQGGKIRISHFHSPLLSGNVILGLLLLVGVCLLFGLVVGEWFTVAGLLALPRTIWATVLAILWGSAFALLYTYLQHRKKTRAT